MSLDSQSPTAPYESSSFATPLCGGTTTRALLRATYENASLRSFVVPPLQRRGRWWRSHQRGCRFSLARKGGCTVFQRAKRVWPVFLRAIARLYGFIILAPNIFEGAHHNPHAEGGRLAALAPPLVPAAPPFPQRSWGTMGAGRRRHTHRTASFSPPM